MEAFFTVLGFFILTACLLYITVIIQENGFAPVLMVFAFPFILVWMGIKSAYEWIRWNI